MKKLMSNFGNILADTILFAAIAAALSAVLALFGLKLRQWVIFGLIALIVLGLFAGMIQLLLRIKRRILKIGMIVLCSACFIFAGAACADLAPWFIDPEFVADRYGTKYVVSESSFLKTQLSFYDYKNAFVSGNVLRFTEIYEVSGYNDGYLPLKVTYFDQNGRPIPDGSAAR